MLLGGRDLPGDWRELPSEHLGEGLCCKDRQRTRAGEGVGEVVRGESMTRQEQTAVGKIIKRYGLDCRTEMRDQRYRTQGFFLGHL